jgi:hypothetical protein
MMLLYSDWPPQRMRLRAMEIVAASLPPGSPVLPPIVRFKT